MSALARVGGALLAAVRLPAAACSRPLHVMVAGLAPAAVPVPAAASASWAGAAAGRLLAATTPQVLPSCGMKVKGRLRRRCRHCYMVARHQRWYIECPVHPRHKQMSILPRPQSQWVLSGVMQSPRRPW